MRNLTFEQLNTLVELSRWGKQAAAELALGKSQSQISRDLAAMEKAAGGLVLIDRTTRQPTEAGRQVLEYASQVLGGWDQLKDRLAGHGTGTVTLVATPDCVAGAVVPFLSAMRQRRPDLQVQLQTRAEPVRQLQQGDGEAALLPKGQKGKELSTRPWLAGELVAALPPNLVKQKTAPTGLLKKYPVLIPSEYTSICERFGDLKGLSIQECGPGREAALEAVAGGLGIALFLQFPAIPDPLPKRLPRNVVLRPLSGRKRTVEYCVAVRKAWQPSGAALALMRDLVRAAAF